MSRRLRGGADPWKPRTVRAVSRYGGTAGRPPAPSVWTVLLAATPLLTGCTGDREIEQPAPLMAEVPIVYPLSLWDQDIEGETLLRVRVTDTGQVDSVEVLESSGYEAFDSAAIAGAREIRFEPARRNGKRIQVWARVPVHFSKRPRPGGQDAELY